MARDLTPEEISEINKRAAIISHVFMIFVAKNRATGLPERLGLWTGDDHQNFTFEGATDQYFGAGSIIGLPDMELTIGTDVRKYKITVSNLTPEIQTLIRGYQLRGATVKIFTMFFSTDSLLPSTTARRRFKGWVDKAPITTGTKGGSSVASIEIASISRNLTRRTPSKRSNENQKLRVSSDQMLKYITLSGNVQVPWGTGKQVY